MRKLREKIFVNYIRNFVFGVEDSLVSTVGLLSGIASANLPRQDIIVTGVILIFVEAFSMGVGSMLSDHSAAEFEEKKELPLTSNVRSGLIMFFSYFFAGFVPLSPYLIAEVSLAFKLSIALSMLALFILGIINAKFFRVSLLRHGLQMFLIGGFAILIGVLVGNVLQRM